MQPMPSPEPDRTPDEAPRHSSSAVLTRRIPITLFMREGTLELADGRLSFATKRRTIFDHPVRECHSVAAAARTGFHVWHGTRCYKLVPSYSAVHSLNTSNGALDVGINLARVGRAMQADREMRSSREQWIELLEPLVGPVPPGVRVRRPWPTWAILLMCVAVTLAIVGIMFAIVFGTG